MTINQEISNFRQKAIKADLTPDKEYVVKGNRIRYVSIGKYKQQLAPLFHQCGLEFKFNITNVENLPNSAARVSVQFILTSIADGSVDSTHVIADGNVSDKTIGVALSYALRMYLGTRFMLTDGIDFEDGDGESAQEILENKSVKPDCTPVTAIPDPAPNTDNPPPQNCDYAPLTCNLSKAQVLATNRAMEAINAMRADGKITEEQLENMKSKFKNLKGTKDVTEFLCAKREMEDKVKGAVQ